MAAASVAVGQVINFHDGANYAQVPGYAVLYFGQGAYSDPGHNVWNGFGSGGSGPGSTLFYGGGNPWNAPATDNHPAVFVATNNPGNPYAAWGNPPTFVTTAGATTWGQAGGQIDGGGNPTGVASGNAYSDGSFSPITLGITCTALSPQRGRADNIVQGTPNWIFDESILGSGASPQISITLSNVPANTYSLYLYAASHGDNGGTLFSVNGGTAHNGIDATLNNTADGAPANSFVEGDNYVIFQNVVPDGNHVITITGSPNPLNGAHGNILQADFNGLQLVTTGPPPGVLIHSYTPAQNVYAGGTAQFAVSLQYGTSPAYHWQSIIGGVTNNLSDGGHISGSGTSNLTISAVSAGNVGLYQCVVSTATATNVSTPAPLTLLQSTATDVVQLGDTVTSYNDSIGAPPGFTAASAVDRTLSPFINFGASGNTTAFSGPAGFVVTPEAGSTIVTGLRFFVATSHPEDDPADYLLEGSNDGGTTFTTISSGPLSLPVQRNVGSGPINATSGVLQEVTFANSAPYTTYRLSANNIRNNSAPTYGLQIGEVQFLGSLTPVAPVIVQQPVSAATLFAGGTLATAVAPSGATPYTYQWFFNGTTPVPGATSATLNITNLQLANSGNYSCVVSNPYGGVTSSNLTLSVVTPNHFQQIIQALNPVGYWSLEETNGTTAWDYTGQHNGTYMGSVLMGQPGVPDAGFVPTNTSFSIQLAASGWVDVPESAIPVTTNLVTGFVNAPTLSNLNITGPLSMMAWIQSSGSGGFHTFFGHGDASYRMDYDGSGDPHFADFNNDATGSTSLGDSKWHLVVGVYDGVTNYVYVDGNFAAKAKTAGQGPGDNLDVWIGGDPQYGNARLFNGFMSQAALFNYALSSAQIFQIFNNAGALPQINLTTNAFSGDENGSATITATPPVGSIPLTVQWYVITNSAVSTNALVGQTNLSLTLTNLQAGMSGNQYFILASNFFGTGVSINAGLTVFSGSPSFNPDLPSTNYAIYGSSLVLSVPETGTLPITNQWFFGSTPLSDGGRISGAHSNVLTIANVQNSDLGAYQLVASNTNGSNPSTASTLVLLPFLNFNSSIGWSLNGGPTFSGTNAIQLTDNTGGEARSSFFDSPVNVSGFQASWIYQLTSTNNPADGTAFVLQDSPAGPGALGNGGGALGFGGPDGQTTPGITPSVDLGMNVYNGHARGIHVFTDGIGANSTGGSNYDLTTPVLLASGDPIQFNVTYLSGIMKVVLTDLSTNLTFTTNYSVDIPGVLGTNVAYVGFTAGTGGVTSSQVVSNFTFVGLAPLSVKVSAPNLVISWPTISGRFVLQQNSAINGTHAWSNVATPPVTVNGQNQVTVPLPPSYTFYRLQLQ